MPLPVALAGFLAKPLVAPVVGFFKSITLKQWMYFFGLLLAAFLVWKGYNWVYDRGAASRQPEIDLIAGKLKEEQDRFKNWQAASDLSQKTFAAEQKALRDDLQKQLDEANAQAGQREVIIREIPKYITRADDAACVIPVNVGLVHNATIEGAATGAAISRPAPGVQGKASTLTLSEYARINGENNSEAVRRGRLIKQWEDWYDRTKIQFEKAQRESIERVYGKPPTASTDTAPAFDLVIEAPELIEPNLTLNVETLEAEPITLETAWHESEANCPDTEADSCRILVVPANDSSYQSQDPSDSERAQTGTWRIAA